MSRLVFAAWGSLRIKGGVEQLYQRVIDSTPVVSILATRAHAFEFDYCIKYAEMLPPQTVDLWVDSGAYSAWTKGILLDVPGYAKFLDQLRPKLKRFRKVHLVSLDIIPGSYGVKPSQDDFKKALEGTVKNTEQLIKLGFPVIPVFHQGEPKEVFNYYLGLGIDYLGISPANDSKQSDRLRFVRSCLPLIPREGNTFLATHNFGNVVSNQLTAFPFYSADSTGWKIAVGYGEMRRKSLSGTGRAVEKNPMHSYRARHLPVDIYHESIQEILSLEQEIKKLWEFRKVNWQEPKGWEL
jgi:hypothetical protein